MSRCRFSICPGRTFGNAWSRVESCSKASFDAPLANHVARRNSFGSPPFQMGGDTGDGRGLRGCGLCHIPSETGKQRTLDTSRNHIERNISGGINKKTFRNGAIAGFPNRFSGNSGHQCTSSPEPQILRKGIFGTGGLQSRIFRLWNGSNPNRPGKQFKSGVLPLLFHPLLRNAVPGERKRRGKANRHCRCPNTPFRVPIFGGSQNPLSFFLRIWISRVSHISMKRVPPLRIFLLLTNCVIMALCGCTIHGEQGHEIPLCDPFRRVFAKEPFVFGTNSMYLSCCLDAKRETEDFYSFERGFSIARHGNFRFDDEEMLHPRPLDMAYAWSRLSGSDDCFRDELQNFRSFNSLSETQSLAASAIQVILPDEGYEQCSVFFNMLPIATIKNGKIRFDETPRTGLCGPIQKTLDDYSRDDFNLRWRYIEPLTRNSLEYSHAVLRARHFAKPQTMIPQGNYLLLYVGGRKGLSKVSSIFIHADSLSVALHLDGPALFARKGVWCYLDPIRFPEYDHFPFFSTCPTNFLPDKTDYHPQSKQSLQDPNLQIL